MENVHVYLKRVYDTPHPSDGIRVLVDRLWPRGIRKELAGVDIWLKEVAPSPELRKWFDHEPSRFDVFRTSYLKQLHEEPIHRSAVGEILKYAHEGPITLVYAARDPEFNHAIVLREHILDVSSQT